MPKEQLKTLTEQMYYVLLALKRERCGVDITEYLSFAHRRAGCVLDPAPFTAC